jgi:hypothetical protein
MQVVSGIFGATSATAYNQSDAVLLLQPCHTKMILQPFINKLSLFLSCKIIDILIPFILNHAGLPILNTQLANME